MMPIRKIVRLFARLFGFGLLLLLPTGTALAQFCGGGDITALSATTMNVGTYDPFVTPTPRSVTITVTTSTNCRLRLGFNRGSLPAEMALASSTLDYQIEQSGGGTSYLSTSGTPPAGNSITWTQGAGTTTRTVQVRVLPDQVVANGTYTDTAVTMRLASPLFGFLWVQIASVAVTPSATVPRVCRLDAPSPGTLSFSSGEIPDGTPNPAIVKSTTLTTACTAPTLVRLTGQALQPSPAIAPAAGFDNFINYQAVATFGGATATLTTSTTWQTMTSPSRNAVSGATPAGTVAVDVNLVAGQPIIAGTYAGVLTVVVDPAP